MDNISVNINLVFSSVEVENSRLDEAVDTKDVSVYSKVETTVTVVDEAVDTRYVDVASKVETTVIENEN